MKFTAEDGSEWESNQFFDDDFISIRSVRRIPAPKKSVVGFTAYEFNGEPVSKDRFQKLMQTCIDDQPTRPASKKSNAEIALFIRDTSNAEAPYRIQMLLDEMDRRIAESEARILRRVGK